MTEAKVAQLQHEMDELNRDCVEKLRGVQASMMQQGMIKMAKKLGQCIKALDGPVNPAEVLGSKGGNTPVKPGSRQRGRPRKVRS